MSIARQKMVSWTQGRLFASEQLHLCVVEADEYDRSFLKLSPDIAVVSAMDADHLDIYGDEKIQKYESL